MGKAGSEVRIAVAEVGKAEVDIAERGVGIAE